MKKTNRIGEERLMSCGLKAKIIAFRNYQDIDIQFEDGTIREHCFCGSFVQGKIALQKRGNEKNRVGKKRVMNNGKTATIIAYRNAKDIDIQFENGSISKHRRYDEFKRGRVLSARQSCIGEERMMHCGLKAKIIAYRQANDIDVEFENGTIVEHRLYSSFRKETIKCPNHIVCLAEHKNARIGEEHVMHCGMKATVIAYRRAMDIDVQFEDGTVVKNRTYNDFSVRRIKHPSLPIKYKERFGETKVMKCGMKATVMAYRNPTDIDVQFENGAIREHCAYSNFTQGTIRESMRETNKADERIGEKKIMKNGLEATIIAYKNCTNIDVQFPSGIIIKKQSYSRFKAGLITEKRYNQGENRIGQSRMMNCGRMATIIAYKSSADIDVQLDTGKIIKSRAYYEFLKGSISGEGSGRVYKIT